MRYLRAFDVDGRRRGPRHPDDVAAEDRARAVAGKPAMEAFFNAQIEAERAGQDRPEVILAMQRELARRCAL